MNDPIKEQLSAFLDGELPPQEAELLLRRLERDSQPVGRTCGRYLMIGEAMRGATGGIATAGFAARVSAAVAGETLAPMGRRRGSEVARAWLRPAAGLGIAASVAAVAILGLRAQAPDQAPVLTAMETEPAVTRSLESNAAGDGVPAAVSSYVVPASFGPDRPLVATRLTNYVVAHSEFSSPLGRRNMLTGLLADPAIESEPPAEPVPDTDAPSAPR